MMSVHYGLQRGIITACLLPSEVTLVLEKGAGSLNSSSALVLCLIACSFSQRHATASWLKVTQAITHSQDLQLDIYIAGRRVHAGGIGLVGTQTHINWILFTSCRYYPSSLSMQMANPAKLTSSVTQNDLTATIIKFAPVAKYPPPHWHEHQG